MRNYISLWQNKFFSRTMILTKNITYLTQDIPHDAKTIYGFTIHTLFFVATFHLSKVVRKATS